MTAKDFITAMNKFADPEGAAFLLHFFKTGEGQYGAGDQFIGVRVPQTRAICREFKDLPLSEIQKLLDSPIHEFRLAAVILLSNRYPKVDKHEQQKTFELYLKNLREGRVNNWDLIDSSAQFVIGRHEENTDRKLLFELARSKDLWQRRAAIISTFHFLRRGDPTTTLEIAELLIDDKEDLIHKAVGWMLREMAKRIDRDLLREFLDKHAATMPRTALRYAIEHFSPAEKRHYMSLAKQQ